MCCTNQGFSSFAPLVGILAVIACADSDPKVRIDIGDLEYLELLSRVQKYYEYEMTNQWDAAYRMRPSDYRSQIGAGYYAKKMAIDNRGWELLSYEILAAYKTSDAVGLRISFEERFPPDSYFGRIEVRDETKTVVTLEDSIWVNEEGEWYCQSCGIRERLILNLEFK